MSAQEFIDGLLREGILEFFFHCVGRFIVWAGSLGMIGYEAADRGGVFYRRNGRSYVTSAGATLIGLFAIIVSAGVLLLWWWM